MWGLYLIIFSIGKAYKVQGVEWFKKQSVLSVYDTDIGELGSWQDQEASNQTFISAKVVIYFA